jgi:sialate O-acetylesterase
MRRTRLAVLAAVWAVLAVMATAVMADVKLPAVIGDHMVLQHGMKDAIWGWADPGEKVTVKLGDQSAEATADAGGRWRVNVEPPKAGGPVKMTVAGKNTLTVDDILVGEVWVCSGQSNMEMSVRGVTNAQQEIAEAKFPKIRLFTVAKATTDEPQTDCKGQWAECAPETVPGFSAVGYFFGRDLLKDLNVPIGLIHTSWGGTYAEAWTSGPTLKADPVLKAACDRQDQAMQGYAKQKEDWEKNREPLMARWKEAADKAKADGKQAPRQPQAPRDPNTGPNRPAVLYNAMIAPIIPYGIAGAIWYQGESNAGRAYEYRNLFPTMIADWRKNWGQGDFPFLFVQLANFMARKPDPGDSSWAELREAQSMTLKLPKAGQAVIIDIGEANDIHPKNKQDVGHRLALAAEAIAYGKKIEYSGPMYESKTIDGNKVRLKLTHVGGGLVAKGDKLTGFSIAGEDKKFVWADARIDGDAVVVSSDKVAAPAAVRYAWADNPECNLYNKEGLPASPFRTDDWPGITANAK